jgi:hypothetical protein
MPAMTLLKSAGIASHGLAHSLLRKFRAQVCRHCSQDMVQIWIVHIASSKRMGNSPKPANKLTISPPLTHRGNVSDAVTIEVFPGKSMHDHAMKIRGFWRRAAWPAFLYVRCFAAATANAVTNASRIASRCIAWTTPGRSRI